MFDPGPGNVADGDDDFVAGLDGLGQRQGSDRIAQRFAYGGGNVGDCFGGCALDVIENTICGQV